MKRRRLLNLFIAVALFAFPALTLAGQVLPNGATRSASRARGDLHDFLAPTGVTLVALNLSRTQENGEVQLERLLDTHTRLDSLGLTRAVPILHINVIAGAPRLVHGLIRRGLAGEYREPVQDEQIIVFFIDDVDEFSRAVGIPVAAEPAWLAVRPDGRIDWWERDTGPGTAAALQRRL